MARDRDYQDAALTAILREFLTHRAVMIELPTGTGKTHVFVSLASGWQIGRVLVMVPTIELIEQAARKIYRETGVEPGIEQGKRRSNESSWGRSPFVVGCKPSLYSKDRYKRFSGIGLVIVDECHLAETAANKEMLDYFREQGAYILGVSATPKRKDGKIQSSIFDVCAFQMSLADAIHGGWLCPPRAHCVQIESLDLSAVHTVAGDFKQEELAKVMEEERVVFEIAEVVARESGKMKTIVFCASVKEAMAVSDLLVDKYHLKSAWVCGNKNLVDDDSRQSILRSFQNDPNGIQIVCNVGVLTTGYDFPGLEHIVVARPTKSLTLYCLDADTEILTNKGWVAIDDPIGADMRAAAFDPQTEEIVWSPIVAEVRRFTGGDESFYSYRSPHLNIRVTDNHRMIYRQRRGRKRVRSDWRFDSAANVAKIGDMFELPVAGFQYAPGVPLTDAELRFVGWFITDGTLNPHNNQITISQGEHQPQLEDLHRCVVECGFKYGMSTKSRRTQFRETSPAVIFTISKGEPRGRDKHLRGWASLAPYIDKDFSPLLEDLTREQLGVLLHAMHLGDGAKFRGDEWVQRSYHIGTVNLTMAERLQSLCVRRGYWCNIRAEDRSRLGRKTFYHLHIKDRHVRYVGGCESKDRPVFSQEKHSPRKELVWCVQTSTGTIVTRRSGKVAILGNCQILGRGTRTLPGTVDFYPSTAEARKEAIAASAKPHFKITDMADNSLQHKLVTVADVMGGGMDSTVIERAKASMQRSREPVCVDQALIDARRELEAEQEEINRRKRARIDAKARYRSVEVDVFDEGQRGSLVDREKPVKLMRFGKYKGQPMSEVPKDYLLWAVNQEYLKFAHGGIFQELKRRKKEREQQPAQLAISPTDDAPIDGWF